MMLSFTNVLNQTTDNVTEEIDLSEMILQRCVAESIWFHWILIRGV